jgi:hypothetical protein
MISVGVDERRITHPQPHQLILSARRDAGTRASCGISFPRGLSRSLRWSRTRGRDIFTGYRPSDAAEIQRRNAMTAAVGERRGHARAVVKQPDRIRCDGRAVCRRARQPTHRRYTKHYAGTFSTSRNISWAFKGTMPNGTSRRSACRAIGEALAPVCAAIIKSVAATASRPRSRMGQLQRSCGY